MLLDYWLAGHLGAAWLRLRRGLRARSGDLPEMCSSVARGAKVSARTLWRVQDFALSAWLWLGLADMAALLAIGTVARILSGAAIPSVVVVSLGSAAILLFGIAVGQTMAIWYRANRVQGYLRRADSAAASLPLPPGSPGLPRRSDFWVALVTATAVVVLLLYAGFHSTSH